jgi:hypothetical protein
MAPCGMTVRAGVLCALELDCPGSIYMTYGTSYKQLASQYMTRAHLAAATAHSAGVLI